MGYLQFHRPGQQNVMFVLLSSISKTARKKVLQKRSLSSYYEEGISFADIDENGVEGMEIVGHCEELIDVPKEFFAVQPKTGFKKGWWSWVNRWWETDPIDQCEFRKRAILAMTIQPIAWFLGFLLRFVIAMICNVLWPAVNILMFLTGTQIRTSAFFSRLYILNWEFLFLYRKKDWGDISQRDFWGDEDFWFDFKKYKTGKWLYNIPISPIGLCMQILFWSLYFYSFYYVFGLQSKYLNAGAVGSGAAFLGTWHLFFVISEMNYKAIGPWLDRTLGHKDSQKNRFIWRIVLTLVLAISLSAFSMWMPWIATGKFIAKIFLIVFGYWKIIVVVTFLLLFKFKGKKVLKQHYVKTRSVLILAGVFLGIFLFLSPSVLTKGFGNLSFTWIHWVVVISGSYAIAYYLFGRKISKFWSYIGKQLSRINFSMPATQKMKEVLPRKTNTDYVSKSLGLDEWYKKHMALENIPAKVSISQQIVAPTPKAAFVLKFKIGLWREKAKVCKPYVKE
jgi:hypothetical protein